MSLFVLMEMTLVAMMVVYLSYHTHLVFAKAKYRKRITGGIVIVFVIISLYDLIFFGFLANACICFIFFDVINLILYKTKFNRYFKFIYCRGMTALGLSLILSFYGMYNAKNTIITTYDVSIDKEFDDKRLMVVSDLHLGTAVDKTDLAKISVQANAIKPEGIILLGDIYDEGTTEDEFNYSLQVFEELANLYPLYYIEGNHEIGFQGQSPLKKFNVISNLKEIGVNVLLDDVVMLDDIYLIGRKDYVVKKRDKLASLIKEVDKDRPLILLEHQPQDYQMNKQIGIDLQLSGHTHGGQIFPLNYLFNLVKVNDLNYGMITDDDFNAIVTSGMGCWGYGIRTVEHSEIVVVNLISKKDTVVP